MDIEKVKKGVISGENLHTKNGNTIILDDGHLPPFKGVTFVEKRGLHLSKIDSILG
jgi:hypothetical protein